MRNPREVFKENLNYYMSRKGIEQAYIVSKLNITASTVSDWVNGKKYPRVNAMQALADLFNVSMADLTTERVARDVAIRVPVLGVIPAGIPIEAIEDVLGWEELSPEMGKGGKEYFGLKIKGDSMYPRYEDGDVVIFLRQETCETGQDCAVMVNGNDATFKRVRITESGITLQPLNPAYDPKFYTTKEVNQLPVRVIGVAVEVRRKI